MTLYLGIKPRNSGRWWRPDMNFTSSHALQHDKNVLQNVAVPRCDPPKSWGYMHRIKWARALPVKPGGRLVAVAIADHVNEKTGSWCISAAQLAAETGLEARAVRRHVNDSLRAYFTVEDRPGRTWRFSMPAPLMTVVLQPRTKCPDPPDKMSDVPCKEPVSTYQLLLLVPVGGNSSSSPDGLKPVSRGYFPCVRCGLASWV